MIKFGYDPVRQMTVFKYKGTVLMFGDNCDSEISDLASQLCGASTRIPVSKVESGDKNVIIELASLFTHQAPYDEEIWKKLKEAATDWKLA